MLPHDPQCIVHVCMYVCMYVLFVPVHIAVSLQRKMLIVHMVKLPEILPRDWPEGSFEALTAGLHSEGASVEEALEGLSLV